MGQKRFNVLYDARTLIWVLNGLILKPILLQARYGLKYIDLQKLYSKKINALVDIRTMHADIEGRNTLVGERQKVWRQMVLAFRNTH